ncbi:hypothetical protein HAX54_034166, partial [Datura stramonium]|nr:hypothetical protein [Datura stramonium]
MRINDASINIQRAQSDGCHVSSVPRYSIGAFIAVHPTTICICAEVIHHFCEGETPRK